MYLIFEVQNQLSFDQSRVCSYMFFRPNYSTIIIINKSASRLADGIATEWVYFQYYFREYHSVDRTGCQLQTIL